jgi:hypothetical protein
LTQGFLSPRECARNGGTFLLIRLALGSIIYFSLNTIFPIPSDVMLAAVSILKANVFLFIVVLAGLFFMALFSLIVAFPINNVLTSISQVLSKKAQQLRIIEWFIFIAGMIFLFVESPVSIPVLFFGLFFYAAYLMIIGYLVFISGYLNRLLGISLIAGGAIGYLTVGLTRYYLPNLVIVSTIGVAIAIFSEFALAIVFLVTALRTVVTDPKETIAMILKDLGEATTTEIIEESSRVSAECKDRIPEALRALESEEVVTKRFSKEKKGYVWTLVS